VIGTNVSICDGKYIIIQAPTGTTRVLRYGEEWRDVTGDNVIGGLAWELQEARERIKRLEEAGDVLAQRSAQLGLLPMAIEGWDKAKEAK